MAEECEIYLDKEAYSPGEEINGRIECNFAENCTINAIKLLFRGRAKVYWKEGRYTVYQDDIIYFHMETDLLSGETEMKAGNHTYPFTFTLPDKLPSTMEEVHGNVRYRVQVVVDKPWCVNHECCKPFTILSCHDLSTMTGLNEGIQRHEEKLPFTLFGDSNPIKILVNLPRSGYTPNEVIKFSAKLVNESAVTVEGVRFKIIQGFEFYARNHSTHHISSEDEEFIVPDSNVSPNEKKSWDLKIKVPVDIFIGTYNNCDIISIFWKLRGEVCLPFPHTNFFIDVPIILGEEA